MFFLKMMFIIDGCPVIHYYILIYLVGKKKARKGKPINPKNMFRDFSGPWQPMVWELLL